MDLVGDAQAAFARIDDDFRRFAAQLGLPAVTCVPISAENGDNVRERSATTPWYTGPTLIEAARRRRARRRCACAASAAAAARHPDGESRRAGRPRRDHHRRPPAGGDAVRVQPSGRIEPRVAHRCRRRRRSRGGGAGQAVTIALDGAGRRSRAGDLIVPADAPAEIADQFEATVVWLADAPLLRGPQLRAAHGRAPSGERVHQPAQVQDQPQHAGPDRRDHAGA